MQLRRFPSKKEQNFSKRRRNVKVKLRSIKMARRMEYVYAALLLHKLKQNIDENNVKNVIKATGATPDDVRVKALVAALSEVNIDEALKAAPVAVAAAAPAAGGAAPSAGAAAAPAKEEKKDEKKEEEALEGLSSLFG
jgi:large subunit ribosomal protein L12